MRSQPPERDLAIHPFRPAGAKGSGIFGDGPAAISILALDLKSSTVVSHTRLAHMHPWRFDFEDLKLNLESIILEIKHCDVVVTDQSAATLVDAILIIFGNSGEWARKMRGA